MIYGELGISEEDYYNMPPRVFAAKIEGYSNKVYRESNDLRKVAFFSLLPYMKDASYEKFCKEIWKLPLDKFDKKATAMPLLKSHEEYQRIMQINNKRLSEIRRKKAAQEKKNEIDRKELFEKRFSNKQN